MRHLLHHYTWLLLRFRLVLLVYAILWAGVSVCVWWVPKWFHTDDIAYTVHGWLPLMGVLVLVRALLADPAPGTDTFWRTRPPRWRTVWASQSLFLLTLACPALITWLVSGLLLDNTAAQWRKGLWDTAFIVCPFLAVAGLCSLARGWYSLVVGVASFSVCWVLGFLALRAGRTEIFLTRQGENEYWVTLLVIAPAVFGAGVWAAGLKSGGVAVRAGLLGCLLVLGPRLLSYGVSLPVGSHCIKDLSLHAAQVPPRAGAQRLGDFELEGVPPGRVAVVLKNSLGVIPLADRRSSYAGDFNQGMDFCSLSTLTPLFPASTSWYHNGVVPPDQEAIRLPRSSEVGVKMGGSAAGWIVRPEVSIAVPLENCTSAAHGLRVRIRALHVEEQMLHFQADVWCMISLVNEIRDDGTSALDPRRDPLVPVLHAPACSLAIALSGVEDRAFFRSWQTGAMSWHLSAAVPLAEAMRGVRWNETTLRGARLVLCRLRVEDSFVAEPDGKVLDIPPPDKMSILAAQWSPRYNDESNRVEAELIAGGEPALRALIARVWPDSVFPWFAGPLFATAPPGLLEEASRRDERWVAAAVHARLDTLAEPVALKLLQEHPARLSLDTLSAAAAHSGPADYPALQRQLAMHRPESWSADRGSVLINKFWTTLRSLPGFDWKTPAHREWRKLLATNDYTRTPRNGLRFAAALAGDVTALVGERPSRTFGSDGTGLLDLPPVDNYVGANALTSVEWNQLAALIDGLPPDSATRAAWLRGNRGRFVWDEALRKYKIQN